MSIIALHSIADTQLFRHREEEESEVPISLPRWDLLFDIHLLRSAAFLPSRATVERSDNIVCRQLPASRGLFLQQPRGPLLVRDALLLGEITRRFYAAVEPEHRYVVLSLAEAARAMGYADSGGQQRRLARQSLQRLVATTLSWQEARADGIYELSWHPLETMQVDPTAAAGPTYVRLSEVSVELISDGYLHYLKSDLCYRLVAADEIAARLWMALECERLGRKPFFYRVFRSPLGTKREPTDALIISELTGLDRWQNRRDAAHRLRAALHVITMVDNGRYAFSLEHGRDPGTYNLSVRRQPRKRSAGSCGE